MGFNEILDLDPDLAFAITRDSTNLIIKFLNDLQRTYVFSPLSQSQPFPTLQSAKNPMWFKKNFINKITYDITDGS